jgi:hypothetical protein
MIATIPDCRPLLNGPTPIRDWSSKQVSFNRLRKAFRAAFRSWGLGEEGWDASLGDMRELLGTRTRYASDCARPEAGAQPYYTNPKPARRQLAKLDTKPGG